LASLISGYLRYSSFTASATNDNSEKENSIRGLFSFAGFTDQRTAILQSRDFNLRVERALKDLSHEANLKN